ncbi:MAG: hypothetical protein C6W55_03295 [Thermobacillus sp.]|nr:MAG: hypothetical protein C6W55_03295 [Thermobacillus sp.]
MRPRTTGCKDGKEARRMRIGVPKEVKNNENRVALTPAGVSALTRRQGHPARRRAGRGARRSRHHRRRHRRHECGEACARLGGARHHPGH